MPKGKMRRPNINPQHACHSGWTIPGNWQASNSSLAWSSPKPWTTTSLVRPFSHAANNFRERITSTIPDHGRGVQVGQYAALERRYTQAEVDQFAAVVQDYNPLHSSLDDWEDVTTRIPELKVHESSGILRWDTRANANNDANVNDDTHTASSSSSSQPAAVVHGMLVASMFSSIFAGLAPGCIYLNQSLDFKAPIYVRDTVQGRIDIDRIRPWRKGGVVLQCTTQVFQTSTNTSTTTRSALSSIVKDRDGHIIGREDDSHWGDKMGNDEKGSHVQPVLAIRGVANVWLPNGSPALGSSRKCR